MQQVNKKFGSLFSYLMMLEKFGEGTRKSDLEINPQRRVEKVCDGSGSELAKKWGVNL